MKNDYKLYICVIGYSIKIIKIFPNLTLNLLRLSYHLFIIFFTFNDNMYQFQLNVQKLLTSRNLLNDVNERYLLYLIK